MKTRADFNSELDAVKANYGSLDLSYASVEHRMSPADLGVTDRLFRDIRSELDVLGTPLSGHPDVPVSRELIQCEMRRLEGVKAKLVEARQAMAKYLHNRQDYDDAMGLVGQYRERVEGLRGRMTECDSVRAGGFLRSANFRITEERDDYTPVVEQIITNLDSLDRLLSKYEVVEQPKAGGHGAIFI
ncbi:MAG: hypothetical protein HY512_03350 [Candidatus Aenigmarchaeota archaeon]|nr:hypothetical protein [Candidatus Aenigmarchaeota archaeon]